MKVRAVSRAASRRRDEPRRWARRDADPVLPEAAAVAQLSIMVEFGSPDGRTWHAIGGGDSLAGAIAFAHESCPTDTTWQPTCWNDLYGD